MIYISARKLPFYVTSWGSFAYNVLQVHKDELIDLALINSDIRCWKRGVVLAAPREVTGYLPPSSEEH